MSTEGKTVRLVVALLGAALLLLIAGGIWLTHDVILLGKIDPVSVAVLGGITGLAGTALGALAAMLVSTRSGSADPTPVTTAPGDALSVTEAPGRYSSSSTTLYSQPSSARAADTDPL